MAGTVDGDARVMAETLRPEPVRLFSYLPVDPGSIGGRGSVRLRVRNLSEAASGLVIAADGRARPSPAPGDAIEISLAPRRLRLIQRRGHGHFAVVRAKLNWSGGAAAEKI